ncbi:MAG TPA: penicillin acylase family protein [Candidatus Angelobacter sp.]|nr:penicillin acylase family protein [Candidatus Angelobacter sp.]
MATRTIAAPVAHRRRLGRLVFRSVLVLLILGLLVIAGTFAWFYRIAQASLPQLDGSITVAGLQAAVDVVRDAHGVPHIAASSLEDLFFAQGYITAQDRLWQMDLTRRFAAGELAEILPASSSPPAPTSRATGVSRPKTTWVDYDKQQRTLRLRAVAERAAQQLPARDRKFFDEYARGINAYIEQHHDHLPVEFRLLEYSPRPWTVADSVLVGISMSQLLNPQYQTEYWREKIGAKLPAELMADLYPAVSWRDRPPASAANDGAAVLTVPDEPQGNEGNKEDKKETQQEGVTRLDNRPDGFDCESCLPGSNNWVVSGAHSTTGKPLLSNDMHLPHQLPGVWYEIQLHSGEFNVTGFSLPGVPFVIVGHNQRIAWGFTNLNPDVQDLFVEDFNSEGEYQTPTGWQKPEVSHEVIHVKDKPDVTLDVVVTRHGPIISGFFPGETRKIALQWVIYDSRPMTTPVFDVDSAQNWEQFRKAFSEWSTPSQNVVYADVDGHIGYQPMGFVPIRASGDGTVPASGGDGKHDWIGYLPFDKLPSLYDPPSGIIATANGRITPDGYPYLLATQWYPPYRAERIYHVLESKAKFSPDDMLALQTDVTSEYDRFFADRLVYAIDHNSKARERARKAADVMRGFDGRMAADSAAATIEATSRQHLWKLLLESKLGNDWVNYEWSESSVALENIMQNQPDRWLPSAYGNFNELLTAAVEGAVSAAPTDLASWKYGNEFPVEINHPLFGALPIVNRWTGPGRQPQSGGTFTVKQVGRRFGPSERMTVDFSNLDGSHFNIVLGESGQLFSPFYMDQWDAWYNNKTFNMPYSDEAVQAARSHELRLGPK